MRGVDISTSHFEECDPSCGSTKNNNNELEQQWIETTMNRWATKSSTGSMASTTPNLMSTLIVLIASFTLFAVLTKSPLISWIIQNFDGDSINSRSLRGDPESDYQDLRFATFGTSRTWGSGLHDRFQAFPYLLSPHVNNLAIRAAGPDIPSQCTATMLGDSMVDVILLEYSFTASDALVRLAHRLRQRFPKATIIFLDIWVPFQFYNRRLGKTERVPKCLKK